MLKDFASKYRQIIILAVASVAIAAYVVPFNWVSIAQTQAQPSLYERLHDRVNDIQDDGAQRYFPAYGRVPTQ